MKIDRDMMRALEADAEKLRQITGDDSHQITFQADRIDTGELQQMLDAATPGPWEAESGHEQRNGTRYWQVHDGSDCIVQNQFCWTRGDAEANARLIALAPQLAAEVIALREALEEIDRRGKQYSAEDLADMARAALQPASEGPDYG